MKRLIVACAILTGSVLLSGNYVGAGSPSKRLSVMEQHKKWKADRTESMRKWKHDKAYRKRAEKAMLRWYKKRRKK